MRSVIPAIQKLNITTVRQDLTRLISRITQNETRVLVEQHGAPVAAIISVEDLERLQRYDEDVQQDLAILEEMRKPFKDVPPEEIEREVEELVEETRQERRRQQTMQRGA